jgi:regulator of sirC expression with transglutaminase-like and TPR domain
MRTTHPARARLSAMLRDPASRLSLAGAALCVAWEEQGVDRVDESLRALDSIAAGARRWLADARGPRATVNALNRYLFGELGFHGNTADYSSAANSFLDRVIATRAGLPITLSVVYLEVGWKLALPVSGVALPGHFLVRFAAPGTSFFVDPFNRGRLWSHAECVTQIATFYGEAPPPLVDQVMEPPSKRAILARILRNLKNLYVERGELQRALAAVERTLLIEPNSAQDVRDRGLLRSRLGALHAALEDLDRYARMMPGAADLDQITREARAIAARAAEGN